MSVIASEWSVVNCFALWHVPWPLHLFGQTAAGRRKDHEDDEDDDDEERTKDERQPLILGQTSHPPQSVRPPRGHVQRSQARPS